ncbi:hypothetical protein GCM10010358_34950 [Streptomyces minutiscleroticus]|uniref:Uncharacterized protein n=1 Tax=Streptomyces minutiscleroticus TaxID=68238 RepID=A0A918KWZ8_9ACTN|nr:hypothetical protein GCM10010358_34950 [Streptomyces minutiscleroticus]
MDTVMTSHFSVRPYPGEPIGGLDCGDVVCSGDLGTAASNGAPDMGIMIFPPCRNPSTACAIP